MVNIVVWNARRVKIRREEMCKLVKEFDIFAITESKLNSLDDIRISGYNLVYKNVVGASGEMLICIKKGIQYKEIREWDNLNNNFNIIGVSFTNLSINFDFIVVYRRPRGIENRSTWMKLFNCRKSNNESIIVGDFNSHHTVWNCKDIDKNGEHLYDSMSNKGLLCVNKDTSSRLGRVGDSPSNLDLIFASSGIIDMIDYQQGEDSIVGFRSFSHSNAGRICKSYIQKNLE